MKLIKRIHKRDEKKTQFNALRTSKDKSTSSNEHISDPLEPFAWKPFFEEAQCMGMKLDLYSLTRTNFKMLPTPPSVSDNAIFGVALDTIMERQKKKYPDTSVPNVVEQCYQYIMKYGLKEIGIFQSSSYDCEKVKKGRDFIDSGNGVDVQLNEHLKYIDVHTVAGLLKQYLREFPQSIIPSDVFDMLVASTHRGSEEIRKAIHLLPRNSYNMLEKIFSLFSEICKNDAYNDADASSVAESFGPVLMWRNAITGEVDVYKTREITQAFIINYPIIFSKGTAVRPVLGSSGFFQPSGLTKSASLSTLSSHIGNASTTSPPVYQASSISSPSLVVAPLSFPASAPPQATKPAQRPIAQDPTRSSSEAPQTNYILELYKNIKEQEEDSDEEADAEEEEEKARVRERERKKAEEDRQREQEHERKKAELRREVFVPQQVGPMESEDDDRKDKGKAPVGGGGMMRKSVSENFANKYNVPQKKSGFGGFLKKIELKKKG